MRPMKQLYVAALIVGVLSAYLAPVAQAQLSFNEVGVAAGVGSDTYDSSSRHGLGINWIDYDNDGDPDLFMPNGGGELPHLYRNNGDGSFTNQDALLPGLPVVEMTGANYADYDNDGDLDIYITVGGSDLFSADGAPNLLLKNLWVENGNQTSTPLFDEVAVSAGVDNPGSWGSNGGYKSYTATWLDYDLDSCIDLFVGTMVWDLGGSAENKNFLYKNDCDGTFTDVTTSAGIDTGDDDLYRPTLVVFGGLMDDDMYPDLYVVNVHDASPYHHDLYYHNNGDGTFTEMIGTMPDLGDDSGAGMGIDFADIDLDGDWDFYMSDLLNPGGIEPIAEGNVLYTGNPDGTWNENSAPAAGVASGDSWAVNFFDLNHDGYEELLVGVIAPNPLHDQLYENNGDGTFTDVSVSAGMVSAEARGSAAADYDGDGDIDFAIVNLNANLLLYENVTSGLQNYLQVDLNATVSNRAAIGALVEATVGGTTYMRQVKGGVSAHSMDDLLVHFGVGSATTIDELKVSWPSGIVTTLTNVGVNQKISVDEEAVAPGDLFTDVTSSAGVNVLHDGDNITDMGIGTGAAWFDYDNDGDQDLYMTMRTGANRLFQNNGGTFTDVAAAAGVQDASHDGSGVAAADYDNDGDKDLYLANSDDDVLFRNNGDGTFTDVTSGSGLESSGARRGTSASWGDYDDDGILDLYVANHEPMAGSGVPDDATQAQDYLYHGNGDGTFTDVSDALLGTSREGHSFIGSWTDYDNDGDLDLFKIHDCPFEDTLPFRFWRNDGGTDGVSDWTFTQVSETIGTDWCQNGMGIAVGDYDRDGDFDYFVSDNGSNGTVPPGQTGIEGTILLRNDGGNFTDATNSAGVSSREWSWGANFFDYDLDGWQDLYLAAGAMNTFDPVPSVLWQNDGDGTFTDVSTSSGGLDDTERTRTSVYADYDADGDPDMFLVNYAGNTKLFRNDNNNFNNWVIIDLQGTTSNRDGIGSKLELSMSNGGTQTYETHSGSSLGGGDDTGAYFGLGSGVTISSLTITWPSGTVQTVNALGVNQRHLIVEDGGGGGGSTLAVSPTSVDFGQQVEGTTSDPVELTLTNTGDASIDVTNVSISGDDPGEFSHDFTSLTIPSNSTGSFNVFFNPTSATAPLAGTVLYRVNAGGALVSDWEEDSDANPSSYVDASATTTESTTNTITLDGTVPAGTPMEIFQSNRMDAAKAAPNMEWDFPVTAGEELTVRLFFVEFSRCQTGGHIFDVEIEGTTVLDDYDVFADVGCETGTMKEFTVTPADANLDINFPLGSTTRPTIVAAIEVEGADGTGGSNIKNAVLTIDHNGTNGSLTVDLTGEALPDNGGGNNPPTAAFSASVDDLTATFTDESSDSDGSVVSWSWDFGDGNTSTDQNPVHTYGAYGTYNVSLTVTDDLGDTGATSQDVTLTDPNAGGAFIESDGMAVMEAENFHAMIERSDHSWVEDTGNAGFSGAAAMASTPDDGELINSDIPTTSPELSFDVDISTTGDYHLWARIWAVSGSSNSIHMGMNGEIDPLSKGMQTQDIGEWVWLELSRGSNPLPYNVGSAGIHTVNVWMREDGTLVDKVLITTDGDFVPTGEGPAESPQSSAPAAKNGGLGQDWLTLDGAAIDLPEDFELDANYPNPFNPVTTINFALPESADVRLEVYDMMGRRVATLINGQYAAGRYEATWNARSDAGTPVASGVYLYRLNAGSFESVKRMVLMK